MPLYALGDRRPTIDATAFVHPDAIIIGDVRIGPESSVWPGAVLRGEDGTVVHCTAEHDTVLGDRCVIGHNAHLEGCTVLDDSLIGSGSTVLHRAVVGPHALVGAGAVVGNDKIVPAHARALGVPAKITEGVVPEDAFADAVATYVHNVHWYSSELKRLD
jgi:carbonic anhydrase/acetyltransferase-like protein (isoleucine patch superfamily)